MTCLKEFQSSVEKIAESNPTIERWLDRTKDLERQLSERIAYLCMYYNRIPKQLKTEYADLLLEALKSGDLDATFLNSYELTEHIIKFAHDLEKSGDPQGVNKGKLLREIIED